jgi:nucleolar pre-ribosomal-associated protein 1
MQLLNTIGDESMAWFKILQNVITIVDHVRLESMTNGAWRTVMCRCLSLLLDDDRPGMYALQTSQTTQLVYYFYF